MGKKSKKKAYSIEKAYPEVRVEKPDSYYASLLLDDYGSAQGELAAVLQYMYHHFVTGRNKKNRRYTELFEGIAKVERVHMELLAKAIMKLGGMPIYQGFMTPSWNHEATYYGQSLRDRLIANLQDEQEAINMYLRQLQVIKDKHIRKLLKRIIEDEKLHIKLLSNALEELNKESKSS
jgi:bacterioferritin